MRRRSQYLDGPERLGHETEVRALQEGSFTSLSPRTPVVPVMLHGAFDRSRGHLEAQPGYVDIELLPAIETSDGARTAGSMLKKYENLREAFHRDGSRPSKLVTEKWEVYVTRKRPLRNGVPIL